MTGQAPTGAATHADLVESAAGLDNICVYCGSASGGDPIFEEAARALGAALAAEKIGLVYGGAGRGLMGTLARAVLDNGGHVTGIIPEFLTDHDRVLREAQEQIVVPDMHTRKQMMFDRADAFVALPGGVGTLEELVEQLTWVQLGQHNKPIVLANVAGFWDPLITLIDHMRRKDFIRPSSDVSFIACNDIENVISKIRIAVSSSHLSNTSRGVSKLI